MSGPRDALHRSRRSVATYVVYSQPGLALATGIPCREQGSPRPRSSVRGVVGVTLGAEGFLWREGGNERRMPAPDVTAVDTLAAGDVWHGAFTLALAEGSDVATAGRFANAAAAIKCSRRAEAGAAHRGAKRSAAMLAAEIREPSSIESNINVIYQ